MLPYRIAAPARVANWTAQNSTTALRDSLRQHNVSPILTTVRYATHQSEGRANGVKQGAGKRLGAKKTGGQYVVPGNIIFRQRGMNWYPGDNCNVGRDHTIFATQAGYVRYYRDPRRHANRQYIGVAFDKNDDLPQHPSAPRKRRLGMIPVKMGENEKQTKTFIMSNAEVPEGRGSELGFSGRDHEGRKGNNREAVIIKNRDGSKTKLTMASSYAYREENWLLGRTAERAGLKPKKRANPILKRFRKRQKMLLERKGLFDEVKKRQKTYKTSGKAQALKRLSRRPQVGRMRSFAKLEKYNRERRQKQM